MPRPLVYTGFMTLDGVLDSPGGTAEGHHGGGWVFDTPFDPQAYSLKGEELAETTALMFGRRSYEAFAPIWATSPDHADYLPLPKYVVSTTLSPDALVENWGPITILRSIDEVAAMLRASDDQGGDGQGGAEGAVFVHGSAELARELADADLIDRYHLLVFPFLLGAGKGLFSRAVRDRRSLRLRDSAAYANGVVKLVYDVVR